MEGDASIRRDPGLFIPGKEEDGVCQRAHRNRTTRPSSGRNTNVSLNPVGGVSSVVVGPISLSRFVDRERCSEGVGRREEESEMLAGRKAKIGRAAEGLVRWTCRRPCEPVETRGLLDPCRRAAVEGRRTLEHE
jgi:hypothetical protein